MFITVPITVISEKTSVYTIPPCLNTFLPTNMFLYTNSFLKKAWESCSR